VITSLLELLIAAKNEVASQSNSALIGATLFSFKSLLCQSYGIISLTKTKDYKIDLK
jgi:hypothetical protein